MAGEGGGWEPAEGGPYLAWVSIGPPGEGRE